VEGILKKEKGTFIYVKQAYEQDSRRSEMSGDFQIFVHKDESTLHLKLLGDLDEDSTTLIQSWNYLVQATSSSSETPLDRLCPTLACTYGS
jgi:hypothetical protein